jgi:hypothetical protein
VSPLTQAFEERLQEIETYLDLLENLEKQVQHGPPRIGAEGPAITTQQQRILYSSVFLQLYNLVEATVSKCLDAVSAAAAESERWSPGDLSVALRREWVRFTARTHDDLNYENRLACAFELCENLVQMLPVKDWTIDRGGGGNWDDNRIEAIGDRLGCSLRVSPSAYSLVKRPFRDDQGALVFIKSFRNRLAHGNISFAEGGDGVTVTDLRDLKGRTAVYLREVVASFQSYIDRYEFLLPNKRPGDLQGGNTP